jgi:hypothetical protein
MTSIFNPKASFQLADLGAGMFCVVVDDALANPNQWREYAITHAAEFADAPFNAYPGAQLETPAEFMSALNDFFAQNVRRTLGCRRTLHAHSRFALVTKQPGELEPRQTICHRDNAWVAPEHVNAASVLYLFEDDTLGGTSFFKPKVDPANLLLLVHESGTLDAATFAKKYGMPRAYMRASNRYFHLTATVPAKFNRMIFYDGGEFHTGDIAAPEKLSANPAQGRLTINGFFTCTRLSV